ncbi:uncharacterized protein LOC121880270 isoform X2 [Homarus americanus]|uniref:uncharacterized protein LOC121880270 isoform X2 n=1 Tax=Homarus americanus TaxID=6706 RepID=UPI001C4720E7|nr:uncharacterized protein LOC121880270 isoform X2 [Homarus americanus]
MAGMVVTWSYSSNLMSLLAVRHVPQPLHTIRQLLDQSSTIVIMEPNTAVTDTLAGMFVLLGAGLQLATLVFCLEVVVGRRKSSPRTHTLSSKL